MSRESRDRSLRELMEGHGVGALLLSHPANFAWYTGGAEDHHQGGMTGYASREVIATPKARRGIRSGQTFAWNPSLEGAKAEETFVLGSDGPEKLT